MQSKNYEKSKRSSTYVNGPSTVGTPYNVQHKAHVDEDLKWIGDSTDPNEIFELQEKLGEGLVTSCPGWICAFFLPCCVKFCKNLQVQKISFYWIYPLDTLFVEESFLKLNWIKIFRACGSVLKAVHRASGFELAIKVVKQTNKTVQQALEKEIQVLKKCRSPLVVEYYGTVLRDDCVWVWCY